MQRGLNLAHAHDAEQANASPLNTDAANTASEAASATCVCTVLFLDIVEYTKKSVAEQLRIKVQFHHAISESIEDIALDDRIILDTGDGAAINFLSEPEDALFVALSLAHSFSNPQPDAPRVEVRLGINLGPVRLVRDANGQPNIIGDGINVAERVISFARPGQVLVSRAYYEMVTRNCADYAAQFSYQGSRTDRHVREHEIFEVAVAPAQALEVAAHRHHVRVEQQAGRDNATERTQPPRARSTSRWLAHRGFAYGAVAVSSALLVAAIAFYTLDSGHRSPSQSLHRRRSPR